MSKSSAKGPEKREPTTILSLLTTPTIFKEDLLSLLFNALNLTTTEQPQHPLPPMPPLVLGKTVADEE